MATQAPARATIQVADLTSEQVCKELERIKQSQNINAKILLNRIAENPSLADKLKSAFEVHLALNMAETFDFAQLNTENLVNAYLKQEIKKLETEYPKARYYLSFLATKMKENKRSIIFDLLSDIQVSWLDKINKFEVTKYIFIIVVNSCLMLLNSQNITNYNEFIFLFIWNLSLCMYIVVAMQLYQISKRKGRNVKAFDILILVIISIFLCTSLLDSLDTFVRSSFSVLFYYISIEIWFKDIKINFAENNPYLRFYYNYRKYLIIYTCLVLLHDFILDNGLSIFSFIKIAIIILISLVPLISHLILRFFLFIDNKIPFHFRTFLNHVSQTGILEKDGGQWRFRHQLLMEALCKQS